MEDLRLPASEHPWDHGAHVGVGQEIEHTQTLGGLGNGREVGDGAGIVDVTPLSHVGHTEVMGNQKFDEARFVRGKVETRGELPHKGDSLGDVPMPLGLADVVQQHTQHE